MTNEREVFINRWVRHALQDYRSDLIAVTGGFGSAKSYGSWQWLYDRLVQFPDCKTAFYTEPVYHLLKSVTIPTFYKFAESIGLKENKHFRINKSPPQIIEIFNKKNRQEVLLRTCQNPEMLIGFNTGLGVMDEAASCKDEALSKLISRNRMVFAGKPQMLLPTTPEGINWFAERFDSDTLPNWARVTSRVAELRSVIDGIELFSKRIRVETADNAKYLPSGYIAALKQTYGFNPNFIKSYLFGYFAPFSQGLAVENYNPKIHDLRQREIAAPNQVIFLTLDWNANPISWLAITARINEFKQVEYTVNEESQLGYGQIDDAMIEFESKFPVGLYRDAEIQIDGDPSGFNDSHKTPYNDFKKTKMVLDNLGYRNVHIQATDKKMRQIDTLDSVNTVFYEDRLYLNPDIRELKRSLAMTQLVKNQRKIDKPAGEDWTHKLDALKYLICRLELEGINRMKQKLRGWNN